MQQTITRKIFGQAIRYELNIEASKATNHYDIRVACLQPRLFQQLLGNSPALLKNQLLSVVKDAAYGFTQQVDLQEPVFISSTDKDVCVQARFSTR
jgi:hypothetical protein